MKTLLCYWQKKGSFVLKHGKYVFGPDLKGVIASFLLTIIPTVLFFVFTIPDLWRYLSPSIGIVTIYLFIISLGSLATTFSSDPGIIPRNFQGTKRGRFPNQDEVHDPFAAPLRTLRVGNTLVEVKYCITCRFYRPPRSSHCSICDNCIDRFDHHCPWLSNCVGRRNYGIFFYYLLVTTVYSGYLLAFCILQWKAYSDAHQIPFQSAILQRPITYPFVQTSLSSLQFMAIFLTLHFTIVVAIIALIGFLLVLTLLLFHVYLGIASYTTNERVGTEYERC